MNTQEQVRRLLSDLIAAGQLQGQRSYDDGTIAGYDFSQSSAPTRQALMAPPSVEGPVEPMYVAPAVPPQAGNHPESSWMQGPSAPELSEQARMQEADAFKKNTAPGTNYVRNNMTKAVQYLAQPTAQNTPSGSGSLLTFAQRNNIAPAELQKLMAYQAQNVKGPSAQELWTKAWRYNVPLDLVLGTEQASNSQQALKSKAELERLKQLTELEKARNDAAGTWTKIETAQGVFLLNNKTGELKPAARGGEALLAPVSASDKKAQAELNAQGEAKARLSGIIADMANVYGNIKREGGAVDPSQDWAANLKARLQASGPGQLVGGAVGTQLQTQYDNIQNMRPLLVQEIRKATQMGARGMDSEKELQFYLEAATDPTRGLPANLDALRRLDAAYGLGLFQAQLPDPAQQPTPAPMQQQAQPTMPQKAQIIFEAQKAIKAGKDPAGVRARLQQLGINPAEAGF